MGFKEKSDAVYDITPQESATDPQDQEVLSDSPTSPTKAKRRTFANPAKAVGRGMSQVTRGVNQGTQAVRGGISQGVNNVGGKLNKVPGVKHGVSFFADYRKFMDRGNVIDLAVAVVIGAAFTSIVTSLVNDIITPILAWASGKNLEENFIVLRESHNSTAPAGHSSTDPATNETIVETAVKYATRAQAQAAGSITWNWGNFIQTVINFFIVSACVFIIVKVYEMGRGAKTQVNEKECDYCMSKVPVNAVRCSKCTTWLDWDVCTRVANRKKIAANAAAIGAGADPDTPVDFPAFPPGELGRF